MDSYTPTVIATDGLEVLTEDAIAALPFEKRVLHQRLIREEIGSLIKQFIAAADRIQELIKIESITQDLSRDRGTFVINTPQRGLLGSYSAVHLSSIYARRAAFRSDRNAG